MSAGYSPFSVGNPDQMEMLDKIVSGKFKIPSYFNTDLKNLIQNVLQTDLSKRFGNLKNGVNDIKQHAWFNTINWMSLYQQKIEPPYVPEVSGPGDYSQFDRYDDVPQSAADTDKYAKEFEDF